MAKTVEQDRINRKELNELLARRILVVDGATGTALEDLKPTDEDFGGDEFVGCNEMLSFHAPHIVLEVHRAYIEAGADIIETNSFNGSPVVLAEYGVADRAQELARLAAELANEAARKWENIRNPTHIDRKTDYRKRIYVMGSMGPGTKSISVTGGITFDEITEAYRIYATGLLEGGADMLMLETVQDTLNLKAALIGVQQAQHDLRREAPLSVSVTIEMGGTMLAGQNIEALYHTISNFDLLSVGINCATGPEFMSDHLRTLAALSRFPVSVVPNAGMPDHEGRYSDGPELFREVIGRFAREGFINIAGGCCGTTPDHIRSIRDAVEGIRPRQQNVSKSYPALAGSEPMVVEEDNRPVYIGERTNTIGSRKFKRLIGQGKWDEAAEIGRKQVRKGAMVLDLCAADPDRDEVSDYVNILKPLLRKVRVPILIDTTTPRVVEMALKTIGGKPAVNSVNLEDSGERLREIATLAKQYSAALICGLIDEDPLAGMAVTVERKLEVAEKIYRILKDEFNLADSDVIFDPLVFPAATGDKDYIGSAKATIEGTRLIKDKYQDCLTILGISNVSFGLPPTGREVVNSVFLHLCAKAGLDMAIVNTQRLRRYPTIPEEDRLLAERLLMKGDSDTITEFVSRFRDAEVQIISDDWEGLSADEKVTRAVVEARREGLESNLKDLLSRMTPLEVINGPLMTGMDEVGKLFRDNRLIVAEVLESAEVMKAAVDFMHPYFPPGESADVKGKLLLATVKGDVHDIGKNLVDMIMSNNGFEVINLGIKVPPTRIIEAVKKHKPDMIGLSGLLVRSAQQMVSTADDLNAAGIDLPLMVGGAALTRKFVLDRIVPAYKGSVFYATEAMEGLSLGNRIVSPEKYPALVDEWRKMRLDRQPDNNSKAAGRGINIAESRISRWIETDVPQPPDLDEHVLNDIPILNVLPYINEQMLYGKHLGVKNVKKRMEDPVDEKMIKLIKQVKDVLSMAAKEGIIQPRAVYRWFKANPDGETIVIENTDSGQPVRFSFPRQQKQTGLSAADWLRPSDRGGDFIGTFIATAGEDTADKAAQLRKEGKLLSSLILQSLSLELAEATAEYIHLLMRSDWGITDPPGMTVKDVLKAKYRGIRLSFGYPACPQLSDQAPLFRLLRPERIGVSLTEEYMMYPEGSVSALVFHHPDGRYHSI